ncbi:hypothetical protein [Arthrobacter rhombi]|uniref:hypothetical protein n=1 Tax=Arthrobacter rhombi TaxID=71253 RepID=UPI003FD66BC6
MSWQSERSRYAALSRSREADDPELIEARRTFKALRLEDHVTKTAASWPPLTRAQRDRVASLLSAPAGDAA